MSSIMHERLAPDILDDEIARLAGPWMNDIVSKLPVFFSKFEQNSNYADKYEFTKSDFQRDLNNILDHDQFELFFESLIDSRIIYPVIGSEKIGRQIFQPSCRINNVRADIYGRRAAALICTDSPIVHQKTRVFPWPDEGKELVKHIRLQWHGRAPVNVLDICAGAGTVGLLLQSIWPNIKIFAVDNSERALKYARFNAALNGIAEANYKIETFNVEEAHNLWRIVDDEMFDIVAIDPPFTPVPSGIEGYAHSAGGPVATAALKGGIDRVKPGGLVVMLTYAFGSRDCKTPATLQRVVDAMDLSQFEEPIISKIEGPVWRLHGEKNNPLNPMPVQYMAPRYYDPDWADEFKRSLPYADYVKWIESEFVEKGNTHLHYVAVIFKRKK